MDLLNVVNLGITILEVGIAIVLGIVFYRLLNADLKQKAKDTYSEIKEANYKKVKKSPEKRHSYNIINDRITAQGIRYRMGEQFTPFDYMVLRVAVSVAFGLVGMLINPYLFFVGVILGIFGVPFYFSEEDKEDNNAMLHDISQMYGIVAMQLKNNVYLSKVIYECYFSAETPRLKKALLDLSLDMEKFGDIKQACVMFRKKFNNKYLDTFAKILEQAQDTGHSVQLLEDIESQMEGVNEAMAMREEKKVETIGFIFLTLVFIAIIIFIFYVSLGGLSMGQLM